MGMSAALDSNDSIAPEADPLHGLPYRALRRLGGGGMGEVFLAQHRQLGRLCVAKILHARLAGDARLADRIRLEAQALGRLNHPHIVSIIGAGKTFDERPFIVMEHLRGETLADELLVRGQLPVVEALNYTCQLLRALGAAHALGIVHRDIKPENLFLCDSSGHGRTLKVLDFGIARVMPDASADAPQPLAVPTDTGLVVGTPRYVSPEGAAARRVDHRADLYAAALVLYIAVAGRGPFDHIRSEAMLLSAHAGQVPEPPSRFAKEPIPPELDRVLLRALRKNPEERYQSADALREDLEQISEFLQSTPGWLDTSVFEVSSLAAPRPQPGADSRLSEPRSDKPPTAIEQAGGRSSAELPPRSDAIDVQNNSADAVSGRRPIAFLNLVLIFLASASVAALAAAAIVATLLGHR
jgi:eukaryotic-like serine/threonine-protein kinase